MLARPLLPSQPFNPSQPLNASSDGRGRAGRLPKVACPGEVALELECTVPEFQTLDPKCLPPCIVAREVCQQRGKEARTSLVHIVADTYGVPTFSQEMF